MTPARLTQDIKHWALELGFNAVGISGVDLSEDEARLCNWLAQGRHGEMHYMERHGTKRSRPATLVPGTTRVISVRMDYFPEPAAPAEPILASPEQAYVSRYALGRDYHKLMRQRLQQLAECITEVTGPFGYRAFVDSAPVMEKALARNSGLGWIGKHTNLLAKDAGSWFFLGELYINLPLVEDSAGEDHCGRCNACMKACPTGAIVAPYELDARLCISYLTIEHHGAIPETLRPAMGNRIYGCDDCQLVCPWNRFADDTQEPDFWPRHTLDAATLTQLFRWSAEEFDMKLRGSAIRRIGHDRWLRNIAVALGNGPATADAIHALHARQRHPNELVREHVKWALARLNL